MEDVRTPRFREARQRIGLKLGQAVRWLGVDHNIDISPERLIAIEDSTVVPTDDEIRCLAETYRMNEDWLRGGEGNTIRHEDMRGIEKLSANDAAEVLTTMRAMRVRA